MPLQFARAPTHGSQLVSEGLTRLSARRSPLTARSINFSTLQLSEPLAVYDLQADAIGGGAGLESAIATGFRYLVHAGGSYVAAAEVMVDEQGSATLLTNLNYGPYVEASAQGLVQVAKLQLVTSGSYEVRFLRFSAIYLVALWLKSESGAPDIVYPLAPAPSVLQAEHPYFVDDFLAAVRELAQQRAANKEGPMVP